MNLRKVSGGDSSPTSNGKMDVLDIVSFDGGKLSQFMILYFFNQILVCYYPKKLHLGKDLTNFKSDRN